ncbi:MAG: glycosyltransferase [Ardenticatenales bacterium]
MNAGPTVTCIVPAYNEGPRIEAVLACVTDHPGIDEVIVVDDGSTDDTADVVSRSPGVRLIRLALNGGKTAALAAGLAAASSDLILLVDADLDGLRADHLSALIAPVRSGRAGMSISLRRNAPWVWRLIGLDYISGERVLHRSLLLDHLDDLTRLPRFGFEVFLNALLIGRGLGLAVVDWPDVRHRAKAGKYGFWPGVQGDIGMIADLLRGRGPGELTAQIITMRRLRIDR